MSAEIEAMEAVMASVDPATWPGLTAGQRCALGRFAKPQRVDEIAELKEALKPFAALAEQVNAFRHDDDSTCVWRLKAGDIRRAAALLEE